jgi:hypothetical protein
VPIHTRWFSLLDEGYVLAIADEMNHGRVLYRDIWIDNPRTRSRRTKPPERPAELAGFAEPRLLPP